MTPTHLLEKIEFQSFSQITKQFRPWTHPKNYPLDPFLHQRITLKREQSYTVWNDSLFIHPLLNVKINTWFYMICVLHAFISYSIFSLRMKFRPIGSHYVSSVGSVLSLFNMDASSGFALSLDTNCPVLGSILFRSRGPEMAIARAPMGAVMMIESTAVVSTLVPHSIISALPSLMAASKASPPMAACRNKKINVVLHKQQYTIYRVW